MRAILAAMLAVLVLAMALPAGAAPSELERASARANAAAAALAKAQRQLSELQADVAELEVERAANEARLNQLQGAVRDVAIAEYVQGRTSRPETGAVEEDALATARAETLTKFVTAQAVDSLDEYRKLAQDLEASERALTAKKGQATDALAATRKHAAAVNAELVKLKKLDAARKADEERRRKAAAARGTARATTRFQATGDWMCPVQGAHAFSDDFGDPRGGGKRRHQGNDILAQKGTPVVASVAGTVRRHDNSSGGISYYLNGNDGIEYYGAHLDRYVGGSGAVSQGTTIGYVGTTGNARGGPAHLHFEIHPGGGRAVNPYPTLRRYC